MDGKWRDLHNVPNVQQVKPLALVEIPEQDLHVQRLIFDHRLFQERIWLLLLLLMLFALILTTDVLVLDHAVLDLLYDRVDSEGCSLEHGNAMVVVDEVRLRTGLAQGVSFEFLALLLLMHILFIFLGTQGLFNV